MVVRTISFWLWCDLTWLGDYCSEVNLFSNFRWTAEIVWIVDCTDQCIVWCGGVWSLLSIIISWKSCWWLQILHCCLLGPSEWILWVLATTTFPSLAPVFPQITLPQVQQREMGWAPSPGPARTQTPSRGSETRADNTGQCWGQQVNILCWYGGCKYRDYSVQK